MRWPPLVNERAAFDARSCGGEIGAKAGGEEASMLASLAGRNLVFSEPCQAVYEVDDLAAYVWRSLDAGMSADQIVQEIADTGMERGEAERALELAMKPLRTLRRPPKASSPSLLSGPTERLTRITILIAGVTLQLHLSKALLADVNAVFALLITDLPESDVQLCARAVGHTVTIFSPGKPEWSCDRLQFIPLLKAQIIESVLACARYEVALHAAALARGDEAILLVGSPGAGKTTLAIALAKAGLGVIADDVVLLDGRGLVTGISLPFTAKAGSWGLISHHWPGIAARPSHWRPDGQELCYILQDPVADPRPRRVGLVFLLNRQLDARTCVEEVEPVIALSALVAEGATRDERLSPAGFTSLVEGLREARCCRLTYSDLVEAADAICSLRS